MPEIMTTREISEYLQLHPITICKYANEGKIPAIRIGKVWRFDKDIINKWIAKGKNMPVAGKETDKKQKKKSTSYKDKAKKA